MLVLSRHRDEQVVIGQDITVTIIDIRGDKVRLGIDAPQNVPVHRREVFDAIQRERKAAELVRPAGVEFKVAAPIECGDHVAHTPAGVVPTGKRAIPPGDEND